LWFGKEVGILGMKEQACNHEERRGRQISGFDKSIIVFRQELYSPQANFVGVKQRLEQTADIDGDSYVMAQHDVYRPVSMQGMEKYPALISLAHEGFVVATLSGDRHAAADFIAQADAFGARMYRAWNGSR